MRVLGINSVFHDPAAALVVDGSIVAAAEEERFSRRKHGKDPVPFSTWEMPTQAARWCLEQAGLTPADLDAVAYSYDPDLAPTPGDDITADGWEDLRTLYTRRAPLFLATSLPGLDPAKVRFVPHHVAHAASAYLGAPSDSSATMCVDGRGERFSHLAGHAVDGKLEILARQELPHSLGLLYEELTEHLGFRRSSDEYKVMALASYGEPRFLDRFRELMRATGDGGFVTEPVRWDEFAPRADGTSLDDVHADLASTVQTRLEEVLLELASWLHEKTGERLLTLSGGVALNCVANSRIWRESPFDEVWVQPASGDAGTALGAALYAARELGDHTAPMPTAALGRAWSDEELAQWLDTAGIAYERPDDVAEAVAEALADDAVVAWFQGASEYGPRALGHRSLMADPRRKENLERLNDVKGREQFRPVAPMVRAERAQDIFFDGPIPSPHMLFTHHVREGWAEQIPAVVHVDGTARIQTVDAADEPLVHRMLSAFERRTGVPVVVNTSLNTAGRPMVDDPRDALECFGSAPVDLLAIGPFVVRRPRLTSRFSRASAEAAVEAEA
ncbi:MAG TPA: carbamoyltransferase C-terminal domain-containing protein [Solirubrobacteraceae bacterium]|nr:carbamoyltransferase C-terminal domain-containing protein [Solirubrobacteraceae bacterium]